MRCGCGRGAGCSKWRGAGCSGTCPARSAALERRPCARTKWHVTPGEDSRRRACPGQRRIFLGAGGVGDRNARRVRCASAPAAALKSSSEVPGSARTARPPVATSRHGGDEGIAGSSGGADAAVAPRPPPTAAASAAGGALLTDAKRCISVGPFRDVAEAAHAASTLRGGGYSPRQRVAEGEVWAGVWVYLPITPTRSSDQMQAKLKAGGIDDALEMPGPNEGSVLSLGTLQRHQARPNPNFRAQALGLNPGIADRKRTGDAYWIDLDFEADRQRAEAGRSGDRFEPHRAARGQAPSPGLGGSHAMTGREGMAHAEHARRHRRVRVPGRLSLPGRHADLLVVQEGKRTTSVSATGFAWCSTACTSRTGPPAIWRGSTIGWTRRLSGWDCTKWSRYCPRRWPCSRSRCRKLRLGLLDGTAACASASPGVSRPHPAWAPGRRTRTRDRTSRRAGIVRHCFIHRRMGIERHACISSGRSGLASLFGMAACAAAATSYTPIEPTMSERTITLTGRDMTIEQVVDVARYGAKVRLAPKRGNAKPTTTDCCSRRRRKASPVYWFNRGAGDQRETIMFSGDPMTPKNKAYLEKPQLDSNSAQGALRLRTGGGARRRSCAR